MQRSPTEKMKIELPLMRAVPPPQSRALVGTFHTRMSLSRTSCLASVWPGSLGQPFRMKVMPSSGSSVKCVLCALFIVTMSGWRPKPLTPL